MGKLCTLTNVTLDGVMQSPAAPQEDPRDGFVLGGWAAPYNAMQSTSGEGFGKTGAMLFGRQTYEQFYGFWGQQTGNPFSDFMNVIPKYVASTTLSDPLPWQNSTLLKGDLREAVTQMKQEVEKDILILGSGDLIESLTREKLIDAYTVLIHPLVLGSGRKLFADGGANVTFKLAESQTTDNGVIIATYVLG